MCIQPTKHYSVQGYRPLREKETGFITFFYIDSIEPDEFKRETDMDINDFDQVAIEDLSADLLVDLIGNLLEDANHHSMLNIPNIVHDAMKDENITEDLRRKVLLRVLKGFIDYNIL